MSRRFSAFSPRNAEARITHKSASVFLGVYVKKHPWQNDSVLRYLRCVLNTFAEVTSLKRRVLSFSFLSFPHFIKAKIKPHKHQETLKQICVLSLPRCKTPRNAEVLPRNAEVPPRNAEVTMLGESTSAFLLAS